MASDMPADPAQQLDIREFRDADHAIILQIWQQGFLELAPHATAWLRSASHLPTAGVIAIAAVLRSWPLAAVALGAYALIHSPASSWLITAAMRRAVAGMSKQDMGSAASIRGKWCIPGQSTFFVAAVGGRVVGCVSVSMHHTCDKEKVPGVERLSGHASLWRLSVAPEARRTPLRVGQALCDAAQTWAAAHGAARMSLICGNPDSIKFYRRIGYSSEEWPIVKRVIFGDEPIGLRHWLKARIRHQSTGASSTVFAKDLLPVTSR